GLAHCPRGWFQLRSWRTQHRVRIRLATWRVSAGVPIRRSEWPVDREILTSRRIRHGKLWPGRDRLGGSLVLQNHEPDQLPTHTGAQPLEFLHCRHPCAAAIPIAALAAWEAVFGGQIGSEKRARDCNVGLLGSFFSVSSE